MPADLLAGDVGNLDAWACGIPVGSTRMSASAGYWVMLRPLSAGDHVVHFAASYPFKGASFDLDVTIQPHRGAVACGPPPRRPGSACPDRRLSVIDVRRPSAAAEDRRASFDVRYDAVMKRARPPETT